MADKAELHQEGACPRVMPPAHRLLKDARLQKDFSLQEVADACAINIRQYQKFESGERDVRGCAFELGLRLCQTLGLDPWQFIREEPSALPDKAGDEGTRCFEMHAAQTVAPDGDPIPVYRARRERQVSAVGDNVLRKSLRVDTSSKTLGERYKGASSHITKDASPMATSSEYAQKLGTSERRGSS